MLGRIAVAVRRLGHAHQHLLSDHLLVEQWNVEDWNAGERLLHLTLVSLVNALPLLEKLVMGLAWKEAVDDRRIGHGSEQAPVAEATLGRLDHHPLQVQND